MQKGGEVERCFAKYGFKNELKPVKKPSCIKRCPVHQVIEVTVMGIERRTSGETDGGVMECVKFSKGALRCRSVDGVAIIKDGQDGHLDKSVFGGAGERRLIAVQKAQASFDFDLQVFYVSGKGEGWVQKPRYL